MKRSVVILSAVLLLLCVCTTACSTLFHTYELASSNHVTIVETADFVGMNYEEDINNATEFSGVYKFTVIVEDSNDPRYENGEVYKQFPEAGSKIKVGSTITLYVHYSAES